MDDKYELWIAVNVADPLGRCAEASAEMVAAFPELTRVRGHYFCPVWGERAHWWCVAPDGTIVDPTAAQFPSKGAFDYTPLAADVEEPVGRCCNCGELSYASAGGGETCCSPACETAYTAYVTSGRGSW